ncbi:hypothetical protein HYR54_02265 [Candidatus Acetothermia bacterium]|nr:hypothetical protein [Candidatus Acetothermia bacterium]
MRNIERKKQEVEETVNVLWDEITEDALKFVTNLASLRRVPKDSDEYDDHWGEIAATLFELRLKSTEAYKRMEKLEALEYEESKKLVNSKV